MPPWILGALSAAAGTPTLEGRDLHELADPALEGNGPGAGLFLEARDLGEVDASLGGTALLGWTFRPLRLAVVVPGEASTDHVDGLPPRLDALFVLSDRRKGGLGVAGGIDLPMPFFEGARPTTARLALGVGKRHTAVVVNLGAQVGAPLHHLRWSVGGATPLMGPLSGYVELDGRLPVDLGSDTRPFSPPRIRALRVGLHLTPAPPVVVGFGLEGHPEDLSPTFGASVAWIPQPSKRSPDGNTQVKASRVDTQGAAR